MADLPITPVKKAVKKASQKVKFGSGKPSNKSVSLNIQSATILILVIFAAVIIIAVSKTDQPMHYLFSPITLITSLVVFLAVSGYIRLNEITILLIVALLILTMYQDRVYRFWDDLRDDWKIVQMKTKRVSDEDEKKKVLEIFHQKIAQYNTETDYYVYKKQVDSVLRDANLIGRLDSLEYNYYIVILPEVIDIYKTPPLADTSDEKITIWAKEHKAEIAINLKGTMYTVIAKAYLVRFRAIDLIVDISKILSYLFPATAPMSNILRNLFEYGSGRKHVKGMKYTDFIKFLKNSEVKVDKKFDIQVNA